MVKGFYVLLVDCTPLFFTFPYLRSIPLLIQYIMTYLDLQQPDIKANT